MESAVTRINSVIEEMTVGVAYLNNLKDMMMHPIEIIATISEKMQRHQKK